MKLKIGFIGFGKSANRYHLPFINQEKFEIVGYYKRSANQFEMPYPHAKNLKQFPKMDDLLAADIDLIVVTSPEKMHFNHAKQVIMAGKNVLIEKPACYKVSEYQKLVSLAREYDVKMQVYQNRRFDSDFQTFKWVLENNLVGNAMEIESNHTQLRLDNINRKGTIYDGFTYGHAVHFIDQIVSIYGKPDIVISDIGNQRNYYFGNQNKYQENEAIDDYYDIKLIYDNLRVRVRFSQVIYKEPPRFIINGTKGCYESYGIELAESYLKNGIFPGDEKYKFTLNPAVVYTQEKTKELTMLQTSYSKYYEKLYDYLMGNGEPVVTDEQVMITLAIMEEIISGEMQKKFTLNR